MEKVEQLERRIEELENKLNSMKLDMMGLEARLTGYRLENINMNLTLSNQITASSIKK
jgi:BMFP domain-containing protein YqiC